MISKRAVEGFDAIVRGALRATWPHAGNSWPLDRPPEPGEDDHTVVITATGYAFRFVLFLRLHDTPATRAFMCPGVADMSPDAASHHFADRTGETANMICGAINRELASIFPHVGMSTPQRVSGGAARHLQCLSPSHVSSLAVEPTPGVCVAVTACVCAFGEIDFEPPTVDESQSAGELEMF